MKRWWLFIPLLAFVILTLFLLRGLGKDPNAMPSALIDKPVPAFELAILGGNTTANESIFRGQPALLNVWATWCSACRVEHPFFNQLSQQGIRIVGLNYKDDPNGARRWLQQLGDPFALNLMDLDGRLGVDLGVFGAPETYLVDSQGIIRAKHVGIVNEAVWQQELLPVWQQMNRNQVNK